MPDVDRQPAPTQPGRVSTYPSPGCNTKLVAEAEFERLTRLHRRAVLPYRYAGRLCLAIVVALMVASAVEMLWFLPRMHTGDYCQLVLTNGTLVDTSHSGEPVCVAAREQEQKCLHMGEVLLIPAVSLLVVGGLLFIGESKAGYTYKLELKALAVAGQDAG